MTEKFFMHRIQKENGAFVKGIEIHASKDDAIRSFWGRMKTGYNNPDYPNMEYVSCMITDVNGSIDPNYNATWNKDYSGESKYFMHHIKLNGETFTKNIDICDSFDAAMVALSKEMEYGYNNPKFPNVEYISCMITDMSGNIVNQASNTWIKPVVEE